MKKSFFHVILLISVFYLSGCAAQLMKQVKTLEGEWGKDNTQLQNKLGMKYFDDLPKEKAMNAIAVTFQRLELITENADYKTGIMIASAKSPRPLTHEELEIVEKEFFFEEKIIIVTPKLADRKTEFGVFAGVVGDFAEIKKIGLTSGGYVHFPMGKKLGLRTGLGYSQLQKELPYTFIGNQDAALSSEFLDASIASPPPFSRVAVQANSDFILEKFHQLDLPVLMTYSPVKKIQFQLGANFSYLIKDKIKLVNNDLDINYSANSDYSNYGIELGVLDLNSISPNQYSDENYWTKLNVSAVAGLAWKPTKRINLGLQYHYGLLPILKSNNSSSSSLIQGASTQRYEIYNNSGDFHSNSGSSPESRIEKIFQKERFTKYNHSLRFTIGYNF